MLIVAAWKLHVEVGGKFDRLSFRRYIVCGMMYAVKPVAPRTGPGARPVEDVRKDGVEHHLMTNDKQSRCRVCTNNCRLKCTKCNVPLRLHCKQAYHAKWLLLAYSDRLTL